MIVGQMNASWQATCGLPSWKTAAPPIPVIDAPALPGEPMTALCQALRTQLTAATGSNRSRSVTQAWPDEDQSFNQLPRLPFSTREVGCRGSR